MATVGEQAAIGQFPPLGVGAEISGERPFAATATSACWRRIPHGERIIATREGDCRVVKHTSDNRSAIRIDLSRFRYAWLKRQLRGGPVGWTIQFGSTPAVALGALDLRLS